MPNWRLRVWPANTTAANQTDANTKAIYTPANPGGILDGFTFSRTPAGGCKEMRFNGSPITRTGDARLTIGPRDILHLLLDENDTGTFVDAFKGIVIQCPNPNDTRKSEYVIVGMKKLIEGALVDARRINATQDVANFVTNLSDLIPPQISVPPITATGVDLTSFYAPYIKLSQAFDLLAQSAPGYEWDVTAAGKFFFQAASGNLNLTTSEAQVQYLPVTAEEVITKPILLVLSGPVPRDASPGVDFSELAGDISSYIAAPIIYDAYEHPEHATYQAEAAFVLPYSESNFAASTQKPALSSTNITNANNATDTNPSTAASNTAAGDFQLIGTFTDINNFNLLGVRIRYHLTAGTATLSLQRRAVSSLALSYKYDYLDLPLQQATGITTAVILYPFDVDVATFQNGFWKVTGTANGAGDCSIYEIEPLILSTTELERIAARLTRLPASEPTQVTLHRYEPPTASVTLTDAVGSPDGDAKEWRYEVSTQGITTTIDLGTRQESEDARVIRLTAQNISHASQGNLRLHSPLR